MFDDLLHSYQELGHMLSDVQENYGDMHLEDVIGVLRSCELKAMELAREIGARREYLHELLPQWEATHSGSDAGMPAVLPPTLGDVQDIS